MSYLLDIFIISVIATIILFSSGIGILKANHLRSLRHLRRDNKFSRWLVQGLLWAIVFTSRMRRAWIRMITPGVNPD